MCFLRLAALPLWRLQEPVAGNFYPINVGAYLADSQAQVSILTDRAQGVGFGGQGKQGRFEVPRVTRGYSGLPGMK